MAVVTAQLSVLDIEAAIAAYRQIKIYRSTTGAPGSFVEVTDASTRKFLLAEQSDYYWLDIQGALTYFYQATYYNPVGMVESAPVTMQVEAGANPLALLSVGELKQHYLFGVDLTDDKKNPYPESMYVEFIRSAISQLESELDVPLLPLQIMDERHDFNREDYRAYVWMALKKSPAVQVDEIRMVMPGEVTVMTFDPTWVHLQRDSGQVQVVPGAGVAGSILLGAAGAYMPLIYGSNRSVPDLFRVDYLAGLFPLTGVLKDMIGMLASYGPFNTAGDLIAGAGIASKSLGIDGLSQSIGTTSSATNSGYGARILIYAKKLKELIPVQRRYYKGLRMVVV